MYDHVTTVIDCHGGHMFGKLPITSSDQELSVNCAGSVQGEQALSTNVCKYVAALCHAHLQRGRIFAQGWCQEVSVSQAKPFLSCLQNRNRGEISQWVQLFQ